MLQIQELMSLFHRLWKFCPSPGQMEILNKRLACFIVPDKERARKTDSREEYPGYRPTPMVDSKFLRVCLLRQHPYKSTVKPKVKLVPFPLL